MVLVEELEMAAAALRFSGVDAAQVFKTADEIGKDVTGGCMMPAVVTGAIAGGKVTRSNIGRG